MDAKATGGLIARRRKEKNWSQGELTEWLHVTDKADFYETIEKYK